MNFETKRLIIRPIQLSDLEDFVAYRGDPEVCELQAFAPVTKEIAELFIRDQEHAEFGKPGERYRLAVELKKENKVIGDICLKPEISNARIVECGVSFSTLYHGKGLAKEALTKVFSSLFAETDVHRIIGITDVENLRCIAMVESLKFRREAEFRQSFWDQEKSHWRDEYLYAMLKQDWEK